MSNTDDLENLKGNMTRFDQYVNTESGYTTKTGVPVEGLPGFLGRVEIQIKKDTGTVQANLIASEEAADRAEAARDAALISGVVYDDEPTGRASVADGDYFKVIGSGNVAIYEYKRIDALSSTLIAIFPSKGAYDSLTTLIDDLQILTQDEVFKTLEGDDKVAFAITDEQGRSCLFILEDGSLEFGEMRISNTSPPNVSYAIIDEDDQAAFSIEEDGSVNIGKTKHETRSSEEVVDVVYAITDDDEQTALSVEKDGAVNIGTVKHETISSGIAYAIVDEEGFGAVVVEGDGKVRIPLLQLEDQPTAPEAAVALKSLSNHKTDYMHLFSYGQSLSRGSTANPPISTSQPYNNVTFNSGVLPRGTDTIDYSAFKPLIEEKAYTTSTEAETPTSGFANGLVELRIAEGDAGSDWVFVGTAPGRGGQPIQNLNKGTAYWSYMMEQVQAAMDLANAASSSYSVWGMAWTQGENNYSTGETVQQYYDLFIEMKEDFAIDVSAITKQDFKPPIVCYQVAAHRRYSKDHCDIAIAQWLASRDDPDIIMACSMYAIPYNTDNLHLTADSSYQLGRYYARAFHEAIVLGKGDWRPLEPTSVIWQGQIIDILFHVPYGQLEFDTTIVNAALNNGFDIWEDGAPVDIINTVSIVGKDRVRITLTRDANSTALLTYARGRPGDPNTAGPIDGPRGNLRDQNGDVDNYLDSVGATRKMHNWCVIFEYQNNSGVI